MWGTLGYVEVFCWVGGVVKHKEVGYMYIEACGCIVVSKVYGLCECARGFS